MATDVEPDMDRDLHREDSLALVKDLYAKGRVNRRDFLSLCAVLGASAAGGALHAAREARTTKSVRRREDMSAERGRDIRRTAPSESALSERHSGCSEVARALRLVSAH